MTTKCEGPHAAGVKAPKKSSNPTPKFITVAVAPATLALEKALRGVTVLNLVDIHDGVKSMRKAGLDALQVVLFVLHDPAAAGLRRSNPGLSRLASAAVMELHHSERSADTLLAVFGPLVATKREKR